MPPEPPPSRWRLPSPEDADADGFVGVGADLEPGTLLEAYRSGLFPMPVRRNGPMGWWSPDPRGVLPLPDLRVTRSLRASCRRYEVRVDTSFDDVIRACADPTRGGAWIDHQIIRAYGELHALGWAHSVEAWDHDGLAGGLYGVAIGGLFAGESMFHRRRDASKVALVGLRDVLVADGRSDRLLDVQWRTDHLATLGARAVARAEYLRLLAGAIEMTPPPAWS